MTKTFKLKDFQDKITTHELLKEDQIKDVIYAKLSGDEYIIVTYLDGTQDFYDSCDNRSMSCFDSAKVITVDELCALNQ